MSECRCTFPSPRAPVCKCRRDSEQPCEYCDWEMFHQCSDYEDEIEEEIKDDEQN